MQWVFVLPRPCSGASALHNWLLFLLTLEKDWELMVIPCFPLPCRAKNHGRGTNGGGVGSAPQGDSFVDAEHIYSYLTLTIHL